MVDAIKLCKEEGGRGRGNERWIGKWMDELFSFKEELYRPFLQRVPPFAKTLSGQRSDL